MVTYFNNKNKNKKVFLVKDMHHRTLYRLLDDNDELTDCIGVCLHRQFVVLHNPVKTDNYSILYDTSKRRFVELEPNESLVLTQE